MGVKMSFAILCAELEKKIQTTYEEGVSLELAERLAAEFLFAMMQVSVQLKTADLDARMRKTGVKAVRGALYQKSVEGAEKKPTEAAIEHAINVNEIAQGEQEGLDKAEVDRAALERYYDIFSNAHIFYRSVSRGKFD